MVLLMFQKLYREHFGMVRVQVTSASELTQDTRNTLCNYLSSTLGKTPEMEFRVCKDLLGGFVITIENSELDKSVRGELEKLRKKILGFELQH